MEKILVSACLLGEKCTYKGDSNAQSYLSELNRYYDIVPFCPEVEGGLPTPRKPSEIRGSEVVREDGESVTSAFRLGAYKATQICSFLGIRLAILKENSPSCGVHHIHDGYFRNRLKDGEGITTAALRRMGVTVLNEEEGLALLEKVQAEEAIKDEKTRLAREQESAPARKPEPERKPREEDRPKPRDFRNQRGPKRLHTRGPAVRTYQGKGAAKTNHRYPGRKPFKKGKPHKD